MNLGEPSNHEVRVMPIYGIDAPNQTMTLDLVPNQLSIDGSQNFDLAGVSVSDVDLKVDGVNKPLADSPDVGVW